MDQSRSIRVALPSDMRAAAAAAAPICPVLALPPRKRPWPDVGLHNERSQTPHKLLLIALSLSLSKSPVVPLPPRRSQVSRCVKNSLESNSSPTVRSDPGMNVY